MAKVEKSPWICPSGSIVGCHEESETRYVEPSVNAYPDSRKPDPKLPTGWIYRRIHAWSRINLTRCRGYPRGYRRSSTMSNGYPKSYPIIENVSTACSDHNRQARLARHATLDSRRVTWQLGSDDKPSDVPSANMVPRCGALRSPSARPTV